MNDAIRNKFKDLMTRVEELEDEVDALQAGGTGTNSAELDERREALAAAREELARISDGCGHGHHQHQA